MSEMHPSMRRFYLAAGRLAHPLRSQSELARALGQSPQTVNNWESRGVSTKGATLAQQSLGISSTWILEGSEPIFVSPGEPSQSVQRTRQIIANAVTLVRYIEDLAAEPLSEETREKLPLAAVAEIEANWPDGLPPAELPAAGRGVIARLRSGG